MTKYTILVVGLVLTLGMGLWNGTYVWADEVEELQRQIDELAHLKTLSEQATTPLETEVKSIQAKVVSIKAQFATAEAETKRLSEDIIEREDELAESYQYLSVRVRSYYILSRHYSPFLMFLSSGSASGLTRELTYRSAVAGQDKNEIIATTEHLIKLEEDKEALEQRKVQLSALKVQFEKNEAFFAGEIEKAKDYQSELTSQIAQLSAKQQAIIAARSGSMITSVGSVPIGSDYDASIAGFNEKAPGGSFGVFAFGAHTHRKGMSQYGAKARAEAGQSYKDILKAYYGKEPVSKDTGGTIKVDGQGDLDFGGYYLMGIAEMPSSWHGEALKVQAVAARTYAYRYKQEGKSICTTEACQVFLKSKADSVPGEWKAAVEATRGEIVEDVVTFYSSTAGGYLTTSGWDTKDGGGSGDWTTRAWESIAGSPWFYKAWYRQGYRNDSNDCGRRPWMSEEEMADILNAWLVLKKGEGNGVDTGKVVPVTINQCNIGGQGGEPYSMGELRDKLSNPVRSISGKPTVSNNESGQTTNVRFSTNRGEINVPGSEFKEVFNTRAPGFISIPQKGFAFFNIERK